MAVKYKRKFRVPGNTVKYCSNFRNKCHKKYGFKPPCRAPNSYKRDRNRCPFPILQPNMYIVSEMEDGTWRCSCPAWTFRRMQCDHIWKAKRNPKEYEIDKEHTGRTVKTLEKLFE